MVLIKQTEVVLCQVHDNQPHSILWACPGRQDRDLCSSPCCEAHSCAMFSLVQTHLVAQSFGASCSPAFVIVFSAVHSSPHTLSKPQLSSNLVGRVRNNKNTTTHLWIKNMLTRKARRPWPTRVQREEWVMKVSFSFTSQVPASTHGHKSLEDKAA